MTAACGRSQTITPPISNPKFANVPELASNYPLKIHISCHFIRLSCGLPVLTENLPIATCGAGRFAWSDRRLPTSSRPRDRVLSVGLWSREPSAVAEPTRLPARKARFGCRGPCGSRVEGTRIDADVLRGPSEEQPGGEQCCDAHQHDADALWVEPASLQYRTAAGEGSRLRQR